MAITRCVFLMLLAAGGIGLALPASPVAARQPKDELPRRPNISSELSEYRNASGISKNDLKRAREVFGGLAKFYADYITNPRVYSTPQEFVPGSKGGEPVQTATQLIDDMNRFIAVPVPNGPVKADQADYIRELGTALDGYLRGAINNSPDRVVQINATRMLAAACKSGAVAHYPTVVGLMTGANYPPEVKYYAYQAAGNLLSAYDVNELQSRKHSGPAKDVADLIAALQDAIEKPDAVIPPTPSPDGKSAYSREQAQVVSFIRRQAIRALANARYGQYAVPNTPRVVYPAYTLGRVAVSDPTLVPPPSTSEVGEAVLGLCNMSPPRLAADAEPYAYAVSDAVATGLITFATPRAANPSDKTIPWKTMAAKLTDAMKGWQGYFDPNYNPARPTQYSPNLVPKVVSELTSEAERRVLAPMDGVVTRVDADGLRTYRDSTLRSDKKWTLSPFRENPKLTLPKKN